MKINISKIELERSKRGLSKIQLSKRIGMDPTAYGKIVKKHSTTISTLNKIAEALHVNPIKLLE
jgi:transcriptional regulator with XRE-family HTH domain